MTTRDERLRMNAKAAREQGRAGATIPRSSNGRAYNEISKGNSNTDKSIGNRISVSQKRRNVKVTLAGKHRVDDHEP